MKKRLSITVLSIVILATAIFVLGRLLAQSNANTYFNKMIRPVLSQSPILREVFNLHFYGDASADYLGDRYREITLQVVYMEGLRSNSQTIENFSKKIQAITGKPVQIIVQDRQLPYVSLLKDEDIRALANQARSQTRKTTAVFHMLVLSRKEGDPKLLGNTYRENGILIFSEALQEFGRSSPLTFDSYYLSTALHEFGHLIGLSHNEVEGCLMNEHAEKEHVAKQDLKDVVTDFCTQEKQEIARIREALGNK